MAFKLIAPPKKTWHRLRGHKHLADVITEVKFKDVIKQADDKKQDATWLSHTPYLTIIPDTLSKGEKWQKHMMQK